MARINLKRLTIVLLVSGLHGVLLFFVIFHGEAASPPPETELRVMKLADIREAPPPPRETPPVQRQGMETTAETIAETMIETEEAPEAPAAAAPLNMNIQQEEYLPQYRISVTPKFDEAEILKTLIYPPIAARSRIEGQVYLELFIDRHGTVRQARILKEEPEGKGFGEAAVKAFLALRCTPAAVDGVPVAVRYRYPITFKIPR
jgi:protein TonB